jgi:hypothetical protein
MPMRSHLALRPEFLACSICNELVELETSKVDEIGQPVHEQCYLQKISLKRSIRPPPTAPDVKYNDNPLSRAIITFLNSANARAVTNFCPDCGSQLERRKCTFFYAGQTWETRLSICLDCDSNTQVPPHDA